MVVGIDGIRWEYLPETTLQFIVVFMNLPGTVQTLGHFDSDITNFVGCVLDKLDTLGCVVAGRHAEADAVGEDFCKR